MTNDIKAIADGLSRHQASAIISAKGAAIYPPDLGHEGCVFVALERRALANSGIGKRIGGSSWAYSIKTYALTPLGLQVRDYLLKEKAS